eukprot:1043622-Prymnesium_polylepis.1
MAKWGEADVSKFEVDQAPQCEIIAYEVEMSSDNGRQWTSVCRVEDRSCTCTISEDVKPLGTYIVRVRGVGDPEANAEWAETNVVGPEVCAVSAPEQPRLQRTSPASLLAEWTESASQNCAIIGYDVEMSGDGGLSWLTKARRVAGLSCTISDGVEARGSYVVRVRGVGDPEAEAEWSSPSA